ncbi:MAG: PAS domain-containing protein, partial [Bacteroidota bacterium]
MPGISFNNRLQTLFDTAPIKIWMSDAHGNYYNFNKRWLNFRGRDLRDEVNLGWSEGVHKDDLSNYLNVYNKAFATQKAFDTEFRLKRADGEYRLMLVRGEPEFSDGLFLGYTGTCIDITHERQMQTRSERMATLLDETNAIAKVGGWEYDVASNLITWTKEVYKIFGVKADENAHITGEFAFQFCHIDDREELRICFKEAFTFGKSFSIQFRIITTSGILLWVNAQGKGIFEDGQVTRVIGALQDVTQQRNADMSLKESERRLHFVLDSLPVAVYLTDA